MKNLILIAVFLYVTLILQAQGTWGWVNPIPDGYTGLSVHFTSPSDGFVFKDNEILVTHDAGETWNILRGISSFNRVGFRGLTGILAGDQGYILRSDDGGQTWKQLESGITDDLNSVSVLNHDTIILSAAEAIYRSFDGGITWSTKTFNPVTSGIVRTVFTDVQEGHAACKNGAIYKTIDGGENWYKTDSVNYFPSSFYQLYFVNRNTGYASREYSDILKTTNGGESWTLLPDVASLPYEFSFLDENNGYFAGEYGYIERTSDGGQHWTPCGFQPGLNYQTDMYGIEFRDTLSGFATGLRGRIMKTMDGGLTWKPNSMILKKISQVTFTTDDTGYILSDKLYKTTDGGATWDSVVTGVYNTQYDIYNYNFGQFLSKDTFYVVAGDYYFAWLLRSFDGGATITKLHVFEFTHQKTAIWFMNAMEGFMSFSDTPGFDGIHKTVDGGETWIQISDIVLTKMWFTDNLHGFGLRWGDLYQSWDGGITWTKTYEVYGDLNDIFFADDSVGYVAGEYGMMLKTTDNGASWSESKTPYAHFTSVSFFNANVGYATSENAGVFKTEIGGYSWTAESVPCIANSFTFSPGKKVTVGGEWGAVLRDTLIYNELCMTIDEQAHPGCDSITLTGVVASNGSDVTNIRFEYGVNNTFGKTLIPPVDHVNGGHSIPLSMLIPVIFPDTVYSARISAIYGGAKHYSNVITFRMEPLATFTCYPPWIFGGDSVMLQADIHPCLGNMSDIVFRYDVTLEYKDSIPVSPSFIPEGQNAFISVMLKNLDPNKTYYCKFCGIMDTIVSCSNDNTFSISSIAPATNGKGLFVYPNPARDKISIQSDIPVEKTELYDLSGTLLRSWNDPHDLVISDLTSGMYFVRIYTWNTATTRKIIKE